MTTVEEILKTRKATTVEALKVYDELPPVNIEFMMGRWKGFEIETGHPMDGMLGISGWYGKSFESKEEVHPLVMFGGTQSLWALNPKLVPLEMKFPKIKAIGVIMKLLKPLLQTKKSKARLRMVEHRGKTTATMLYDDKAIYDHFARIDENTVLGCMDLKGNSQPYFWVMERDDKTDYSIQFNQD